MASEKNEPDELIITRKLSAPRELVFSACTRAEHLANWWGPPNAKFGVKNMELKPGGIFHYYMESPDGSVLWAKFVYIEIVAPEKIEFLNCFSDAGAGLGRFPMMPEWPSEMHTVLTLTEENGETTLTIRVRPYNATVEETKTFIDGFSSMQQGFGASFNQLEKYLSTL